MKPEFNFKFGFSLEKYIQSFFLIKFQKQYQAIKLLRQMKKEELN